MARGKKILFGLFVFLLLLLASAYFVGNHLLNSYSQRAIPAIAKRGKQHGIVIEQPTFEKASITGIRTANWSDLEARVQFPDNEAFDPNRIFDVHVGDIDLWLTGSNQVTLEARDIAIDSVSAAAADDAGEIDPQSERIRADRFRCVFELELTNPLPGLVNVLPELVGLMRAGATRMPVATEGSLEFALKGRAIKTRIQVADVEGGQSLVLSADDLRPVSDLFDESLTEAEIEILSTYPMRAAQLLRVKDDAESTSKRAFEQDEQVPQDAYRHVLWSFLLTNKYGTAFAERVTDAHEEGNTGNSPAERDMDYHNNAIGRRLTEEKILRQQILSRVMNDTDVIRQSR